MKISLNTWESDNTRPASLIALAKNITFVLLDAILLVSLSGSYVFDHRHELPQAANAIMLCTGGTMTILQHIIFRANENNIKTFINGCQETFDGGK